MKEKKLMELHLSTILLILTIIIISVMAYFIFRLSNEKQSIEETVNNLNEQIYNLENTSSNLQEKIDLISNTINNNNTHDEIYSDSQDNNNNNNNNNDEIQLDAQYNNTDYGIKFSYTSDFAKLEDTSLKDYSVETFEDNKGNGITINKDNTSINDVINNVKTLTTPDGTLFNTNIKEDGYIILNSGVKGYKMEMISDGDNVIKFITQKGNNVFTFSFIITGNFEQNSAIFNKIINTISID